MDNRHRKLLQEYKQLMAKKMAKKKKAENDAKTKELDNQLR